MSHFDKIGIIATIPDCAKEIGITNQALWLRLRNYPDLTKPVTFRAGGTEVLIKDNARTWIKTHMAEWSALQAAKKTKWEDE